MTFTTILEAIEYYAKKSPDKTCLIEAKTNRILTYGELWKFIAVFAKRLRTLGLKKGDRVTVRMGNFLETFVARFGINLAGGVYCPVERNIKEYRLLEIIKYLDSNFIVSTEYFEFSGEYIDLSALCLVSPDTDCAYEFSPPQLNDLCAILFTTGTTGKAKGVMLNYNTFALQAAAFFHMLEFTSESVFMWTNPLDRIASEVFSGAIFFAGGTSVHNEGIVFVNDFFDNIDKYKITSLFFDPSSLSILLKSSSELFKEYENQLKTISFAGSFMAEKLKRQMQSLLPETRLFLCYGTTEASCAVTAYDFSQYPEKLNCVGKPYPFVKIYLLDNNGDVITDSSENNIGIVACESPALMLGYWKDEELTSKVLNNGRLILADMGYMDDEGFLYLAGRKDDVIVTGGHKVAPYEIEDIAMQFPGVLECVCVAEPNNVLGEVPKLFVVMKENQEFSVKDIAGYLRERLETYKLPRIIQQLDTLPRVGESQKIDRKVLKDYK